MASLKQAIGKYWVVYYLAYTVIAAVLTWCYRARLLSDSTASDDRVYLLAAIFGVSAGISLLIAIILEVIVSMVLLIPRAWEHVVNKGREQGREQGRKEVQKRVQDIIAEHGQRDPETGALTISEEGLRLLNNPNAQPR